MQAMRVTAIVAAVILGVGWLAARAPADEAAPAGVQAAATVEAQIDQIGYFKSNRRERVMTFRSDRRLTEAEALAFLTGQFRTEGRLFRAAIYSGAAPVPGEVLTLAPSLARALQITANPPFDQWDWMLVVNPAGQETLMGQD